MRNKNYDPAWRVILERSAFFNDANYGEFVSKWSFDYYRQRALNVGFAGLGRVLDVGCGHGHWTCALSSLNTSVAGVDIHPHRVQIASELIRDLWIDNATVGMGDAMALPFADEEFDGLFCYGVFMFLDPAKALSEFRRVLKPGGKLYICTNGPGWWLRLFLRSVWTNRAMSMAGLRAFVHSSVPGTPTSFTAHRFRKLLLSNGFELASAAAEGTLTYSHGREITPVYGQKFLGLDNVIEAVAFKSGTYQLTTASEPERQFPTLREMRLAVESHQLNYVDSLERFHSCDTIEVASATHPPRLSYARAAGVGLDRVDFLAATVSLIIGDCQTNREKISKLANFCQKYFYHHFAIQPIADGVLLDDPVELSAFRVARCGSSARFLADLLEIAGYETGLIGGACHTTVEVLLDGKWRLLDSNLYPPGTLLVGDDGDLLPTSQAISEPARLDLPPSYINYNIQHIDAFCEAYPSASAGMIRHLRNPIFPSIGYFGGEFAGERAGKLIRYRKAKQSGRVWTDWSHWYKAEELSAPILNTRQRPEQVRSVDLRGTVLTWISAATAEVSDRVTYDVHVSAASRGWNYDSVPADCRFQTPGHHRRTTETSLDISDVLVPGSNYVTIIARHSDALSAFHLPSDEFVFKVRA